MFNISGNLPFIERLKIVSNATICVNLYFAENSAKSNKKCLPKTERDQIFSTLMYWKKDRIKISVLNDANL